MQMMIVMQQRTWYREKVRDYMRHRERESRRDDDYRTLNRKPDWTEKTSDGTEDGYIYIYSIT